MNVVGNDRIQPVVITGPLVKVLKRVSFNWKGKNMPSVPVTHFFIEVTNHKERAGLGSGYVVRVKVYKASCYIHTEAGDLSFLPDSVQLLPETGHVSLSEADIQKLPSHGLITL